MAPAMRLSLSILSLILASEALANNRTASRIRSQSGIPDAQLGLISTIPRDKCPPCFNCMLPVFTCGQYGLCSEYDGQCKCPPGWGGIDCLTPQCDSLADGDQRRLREPGTKCDCKDGWGGINCNVCQTDDSCQGFPLPGSEVLDGAEGPVANMTCYTGGETVFTNHQMCNVTNRKIIDQVGPERPPQVTFSCDKASSTCSFQFWTAEEESFYCGLEDCTSRREIGYEADSIVYACEHLKCSCVPGRFICGEDGSVDIGDFLTEEIKGPAKFSCTTGAGCKFEEPAMNSLINDIFGDPYITLNCNGGECVHISQVPGYVSSPKPDNTRWVAASAAGACLFVLVTFIIVWYSGRIGGGDLGQIRLPENEAAKLMTEHVPASLHFSNLSYHLAGHTILDNITGAVKPGQVMAIMGASGAGKSTLLDILARKSKRGEVSGTALVNGRQVKDEEFKSVSGFVDQEDTLMSTLTVYETVLYSALLRLPRDMSFEAKRFRTMETLHELGILGIKDSRIGDAARRSISGGEKRRVSIACELVTSPSILFLDEPTSGLDAYNAFNVVESLVSLAKNYNRTVIFTIHQPRSNIVALFDQLLVLAFGKLVYSGEFLKCQQYFEDIGRPCPPGFNIADFLIDMTMHANQDIPSDHTSVSNIEPPTPSHDTRNLGEEEQGLASPSHSSAVSIAESTSAYLKHKTSQLFDAVRSASDLHSEPTLTASLATLVQTYATSEIAQNIRNEISEALASTTVRAGDGQTRDVAEETTMLRGRKRASWVTQFRILSGRAFKNLYRDPALLASHYIGSIVVALICGFFFHNVTNDIAGFQNRLGLFFFSLALFGFSCLSSLGLFANERILFMRERSNGYYSSFTYFSSKILFDILPLRLIPPLVFGAIVYGLAGLVPTVAGFWKFMLTLVLFNLTTASIVLWLSIAFANVSVASLTGTLIMLYNLLFTGLLINRESVTPALRFLHTISFFHAAFEALAVNELRYLHLKEVKYGVELDVPAALILSVFGLKAQSFWWPNIVLLGIFLAVCTVGSYVTLHFYVREKR